MLTALLVYSFEKGRGNKKDDEKYKIDKFLLNNDFLLKGALEDIRNYQKNKRKSKLL